MGKKSWTTFCSMTLGQTTGPRWARCPQREVRTQCLLFQQLSSNIVHRSPENEYESMFTVLLFIII